MEDKNIEATHEVDIHISNWWRCVTDLKQKGETLEITYDKSRLEDEKHDPQTIVPPIQATEEDEFSSVKLKLLEYQKVKEFVFRVIRNDEELEKLGELFKAGKLGDKECSHTIFLTEVRGGIIGDIDERTKKVTISNFSYCYFNIADFMYYTFNEANFNNSTFNKADFSDSTFNKADFFHSTFNKANFWFSTFKERANFSFSTFKERANFIFSTFNNEADFGSSTFNNEADFMYSTFNNTANFKKSTFKTTADFNSLRKCKFIEFENATINFLDIKFSRTPLKVSLKGAQIEKIDFTDTVIESSPNRETFTVLKNIALKQNDQISALDFYQKEIFTYFEKLTWRGNFTKKFILLVEKWVSKYGTSWVRAGISILVFNFLIALINNTGLLAKPITDPLWVDALIQTINNINIFDRAVFEAKPNIDKIIHFVRLAGNAFLYYEFIKSLRMFSRKL